jgi:hypothetical protein
MPSMDTSAGASTHRTRNLMRPSSPSLVPGGFGLTEDLLFEAQRRVEIVLGVMCAGAIVSTLVRGFRVFTGAALRVELPGLIAIPLVGAVSGSLFCILRLRRDRPGLAIRLGLLAEVLLGYLLSIEAIVEEGVRYGHAPHVTWTAPLVIAFAFLVPSPPRLTLAVASATGSSVLVGIALADQLDLVRGTLHAYLDVSIGQVVATAIAFFGSQAVFSLSRRHSQAKRAGSYRLTRKLGSGGMGEVWLAEHALLARPAAVKVMLPDAGCADAKSLYDAQERFRREARATAQLRSPHTVKIYDYGVTTEGGLFYVMELLNGYDLDTVVREHGPLSAERVVHVLLQATRSLAEAHDNGIVHRDVKPANIFLCREGLDLDFVKVLDFGLVKVLADSGQPAAVQLTQDRKILGSPAFMSPEQISGPDEVGPASDIYSLGCVAHWLLTGKLPFQTENYIEMMMHHVATRPSRPSQIVASSTPPELDDIVEQCLAKRPDLRPASMRALHDSLLRTALGQRWTHEQALAWWKHRAPMHSCDE